MKIRDLQTLTGKKYSSKDKQMELLQAMADDVLNRTGVYGRIVLESKEDHIQFHFENQNYGKIEVPFDTTEELNNIKEAVFFSYHEAENIHYRMSYIDNAELKEKIALAENEFEKFGLGKSEPYTHFFDKFEGINTIHEKWYFEDLLEIHSYIHNRTFEYAFVSHRYNEVKSKERKLKEQLN